LNKAFSIPLGFTFDDSGTADRNNLGVAACLPEYVADPENTLLAAVTDPSKILRRQFSPLVLSGPSGVGKSFLAHGLKTRWSHENPQEKTLACTGADFARSLAKAIDTDAIGDFRTRFRSADILVLDNITELARKDAAQCEFARTIDHIHAKERIVIVTSRVPPSRLNRFSPQLISRLSQGLLLPLRPPGTSARREIVTRLAGRHGIQLSDDATTLLVSGGPVSVVSLNSFFLRIKASEPRTSQPLDHKFVRSLLAESSSDTSPNINAVTKIVAKRFRLKVADLRSSSRRQQIVRARGTAMFLARKHTGLSLERVGEYFGKRDHTTVLHACRQTEERLASDPELRNAVNDITNQLNEL